MSARRRRRVAVLGAGIGRQHLAALAAMPDRFEVAALCDRDGARAAEALAATGLRAPVVPEVDALIGDPSIDVIDVCLPPHLHVPVAQAALAAGHHVVCEKPLASSPAEADVLVAAARAAGRMLFPVFQYRYGLAMDQLRALSEAGLTGRPFVASLETHWDRRGDYYAVPWRGTWSGENGGAVLGHAIHNHDLLAMLFGPVETVSATVATRVNPIETEDCAAIAMTHRGGAVATSSVTLGAAGDTTRLRLCYARLTAESGAAPYAPAEAPWRYLARDPADQNAVDAVVASVRPGPAGFAGFFGAVADALDGDPARAVPAEAGRASIELVAAIYAAARTGARVALPLARDHPFHGGWRPT